MYGHHGGCDWFLLATFGKHNSVSGDRLATICLQFNVNDEKIYVPIDRNLLIANTCTMSSLHYSTLSAELQTR